MNSNIHTFIGCDASFDESEIVIFGAPYDSTTSYRPGARFGPPSIRNESFGIETYSPYIDKDITDYKIFDAGDIELPFGAPEPVLDMIEDFAAEVISAKKLPLMLGGEHLVTLGAVRAAAKAYDGLHIIQFDAHADLRDDYLGSHLSHATVMRRCGDIIGYGNIHQFGIRSGDREEFQFAEQNTDMHKFSLEAINGVKEKIGNAPVYITIDLDVLDPAYFPGTGTPEAGGVDFCTLISALDTVCGLNVVGADMTELSPMYDLSGASTALACKLMRELLLRLVK